MHKANGGREVRTSKAKQRTSQGVKHLLEMEVEKWKVEA